MKDKHIPIPENEKMDIDINSYADVPGNTHLSDPMNENNDELETLKQALEAQKEKFLRQAAEFENYKRRTAKERMELMQTAGKDVIVSMLEVLDDADRAEMQMGISADLEQVKQGTILVFNKLRSTLQSKGLKPMISNGTEFDMDKHEAITQADVEEDQQGKVVDELQKGYYLNDKLIRFAKVVVGK